MFFENRFTLRAEKVIRRAHKCAAELGHGYVGSEHLLLAISCADGGAIAETFGKLGITSEKVRRLICERTGKGRRDGAPPQGLTEAAKQAVMKAFEIAAREGKSFIGEEHLLLGILEGKTSTALVLLAFFNVTKEKISGAILSSGESEADYRRESASQKTKERSDLKTLKGFGKDMCELARLGRFDPIIGRESELSQMIQILLRRTKNNPLLLGEAGVGKTALAEGLAGMIVRGLVPNSLANKKIYSVDISSVVAGTKYRGEFEERIKTMFSEVARAGDIILFIDEIHTIVGAGAAEGAIDAANILKPALSRGEAQIIGATTFEEYHRYIEKDAALSRRFQTVNVSEPSEEECVQIIEGIAERYEKHHGCRIDKSAIDGAVSLSKRYIQSRKLPDKAIDLIDEALAKRRIKEEDRDGEIRSIEEEIAAVFEKKKQNSDAENFEEAARLRDEEEKLKQQLCALREGRKHGDEELRKIGFEEIAELISEKTKIPLSRITNGERARLLALEDELCEEIFGQSAAVASLCRAIRASRAGLSDESRPIGSFLFAGPTGVGKTALCRALSEKLFGGAEKIIRLDMSEYMEKHSVSKLIGSPPGYIGYDDGKTLVSRVCDKPYSVVLFDEIEKANADVLNILLQILDEGRLSDSHGRCADFKNTIIIMTSNIGASRLMASPVGFAEGSHERKREMEERAVRSEITKSLPPELVGRIDEVIVFSPLSEESLLAILRRETEKLVSRAEAKGIELYVDRSVMEHILESHRNAKYGAREIIAALRRELSDKLAEIFLSEKEGKCTVFSENGEIKVRL